MDNIALGDFPPDHLVEIVHWHNDPVVNRYLWQSILALEDVQAWYVKYFSGDKHKPTVSPLTIPLVCCHINSF
jgi:hypothetical protein